MIVNLADVLKIYFSRIFPFDDLFKWLYYGEGNSIKRFNWKLIISYFFQCHSFNLQIKHLLAENLHSISQVKDI